MSPNFGTGVPPLQRLFDGMPEMRWSPRGGCDEPSTTTTSQLVSTRTRLAFSLDLRGGACLGGGIAWEAVLLGFLCLRAVQRVEFKSIIVWTVKGSCIAS